MLHLGGEIRNLGPPGSRAPRLFERWAFLVQLPTVNFKSKCSPGLCLHEFYATTLSGESREQPGHARFFCQPKPRP